MRDGRTVNHPCLEWALDIWYLYPGARIWYDGNHVVVEKFGRFRDSMGSYESFGGTPLEEGWTVGGILAQFFNLNDSYVIKLELYYSVRGSL